MISIKDLSFTYPGANSPALRGINWEVPAGEICLVIGSSGAGKSTLLRCINGLVPHFSGGSLQGSIRVNDLDPVNLSPREMSHSVGFVFQDPEAQFVVDIVEDEIVFSLENASIPDNEMESRLEEALNLLELTSLRSRKLETLSGGERQRVAIAAALALRPRILILDEPTSQLDPLGAEEVLHTLMHLNKQLGLTVILAEHRMERILPYSGQIIYLSDDFPGGLSGKPQEVLNKVKLSPPLIVLGKELGWKPLPLTIEDAQEFARHSLEQLSMEFKAKSPAKPVKEMREKSSFIQAKDVQVSFGNKQALRGVDISIYTGEITVLMGPNGSGKTTLLRSLIGLIPTQAGCIYVNGKDIKGRSVAEICQQVGYLPQDPNALLFADTVLEELLITLYNHNLDDSDLAINPAQLLERLGLANKANNYPRDLSTGERQRVAMGAVMVTHPGALILDEPTRGLDYTAKKILLNLLRAWCEEGMAILMVTHDVALAVQAADRVILLENGLVTRDGSPGEVLLHSTMFSPQVAKIFPGRGWLTVEDAIGGLNASQHRN
jgi:energy-coupling factor transport system ATP-binding protein